ncbi:MAG: carbonic anhydrase family protein [Deltaproteobacteria bacterium]
MTATRPMPNLGTQQSPIDLVDPFEADIRVKIAWNTLVLKAKDDGYDPSRKLAARAARKSGHIEVDGQRYIPVDLHWHFPCEHTLKSKSFPAEAHIVHVHKDDVPYALQGKLDWCRIAVLGIFIKRGREAYAPMSVATATGEVRVARDAILPAKPRAVRYDGSLTTPPYSENVTFVIFEDTMSATGDQLDDGGLPNARALQDINRRCCVVGDVASKR